MNTTSRMFFLDDDLSSGDNAKSTFSVNSVEMLYLLCDFQAKGPLSFVKELKYYSPCCATFKTN